MSFDLVYATAIRPKLLFNHQITSIHTDFSPRTLSQSPLFDIFCHASSHLISSPVRLHAHTAFVLHFRRTTIQIA